MGEVLAITHFHIALEVVEDSRITRSGVMVLRK